MLSEQTQKTLELLMAAQAAPSRFAEKSFNQALGLVYYDLEPVAKQLYPVITPLRNNIPRVRGEGGTATNWKAITAINTTGVHAGVAEGKRSRVITTTEADFTKSYKGIGLEDDVTFEADYAAENFDNVRALAVEGLLRAMFIAEEDIILNGNAGGLLLGTPTAPVATLLTSQGSMTAGGTKVFVCALTPQALALMGGPGVAVTATAVPVTLAVTNADGTSDTVGGGSSALSAGSNTVTTATTNLAVSANTPVVKGAAGYAWFAVGGQTTSAGAKLAAVTTINSVVILADGAATQVASAIAADNTANALIFDGIITQALATTGLFSSNATGTDGTGTGLTTDTAAGIVEIDTDLETFWKTRRLSPTEILVNSQEVKNITKKVIAAGGAPLFRFVGDNKGDGSNGLTAGAVVGQYLNKFSMGGSGNLIPIRLHPNVSPGTIVYLSDRIPYPLSNVRNVLQIKTRREYYQIEWPLKTRKYEYGVYADELLQMYAPFAFGVRSNIANA